MNLKNQFKLALAAGLVAAAPLVHAQGLTTSSAPAAAPAPVPAPSPAKQALINELLEIERPGVEAVARSLVQRPLQNLMQSAGQALQSNVPADKRQAVAQSIEASMKQFAQTNGDTLASQAVKLEPSILGTQLNERFTEEELRQLVTFLKSPTSKKFAEVGGQWQGALAQKLVADNGPTLETHFKALQLDVAKQLGVKPAPAAASAPAKK